ncbi:MAG: hypothetical protein IJI77_03960 [Erysipelotrichaceae bacterium]|nr:hypothetical protein [Erysipelotrichaceae bacterium]
MNKEELMKDYPFLKNADFIEKMPEGLKKRVLKPFLDDLKEAMDRNKKTGPLRIYVPFVYSYFEEEYPFTLEVASAEESDRLELISDDLDEEDPLPEEWKAHETAWKYIFERTCEKCGAFPVPLRDKDHVRPLCDECLKEELASRHRKNYLNYLDIFNHQNYSGERLLSDKTYRFYGLHESEDVDLKPFFEKIGYHYDGDVYYRPIRKMPKEDYDAFIKDIVKNAETLWSKYSEPVWDDIPGDKKVKFTVLGHAYERYLYQIYRVDKNDIKELGIDYLPHWYFYPEAAMPSAFWRMGPGEDAGHDYWQYYQTLKEEQKIEHRRKYPRPYYMDDEAMMGETEFIEEEEKEAVAFVYRDKQTNETITVPLHYHVFGGLSKKEQEKQFEEKRMGLASYRAGEEIYGTEEPWKNKNIPNFEERMKLYRAHLDRLEFVEWHYRESNDSKQD